MNAGVGGGQKRALELQELESQIGGQKPSNMSARNQTAPLREQHCSGRLSSVSASSLILFR